MTWTCSLAPQVMAGGPGFMRPLTEFTVRLCFVNFDGGAALAGWKHLGCQETPDQEFLDKFCNPVVQVIKVNSVLTQAGQSSCICGF